MNIDYSLCIVNWRKLNTLRLKADIVDISDGGIGIRTDYPVEAGQVLKFDCGLKHNAGIVRWATMHDATMYNAGVMFV